MSFYQRLHSGPEKKRNLSDSLRGYLVMPRASQHNIETFFSHHEASYMIAAMNGTRVSMLNIPRFSIDDCFEHTATLHNSGMSQNIFLPYKKGQSPFVFNPGSAFHLIWNLIILLFTLLISVITPIELAWSNYDDGSGKIYRYHYIYVMDIAFYVVFTIDIIIQFNTAIWLDDGTFLRKRRVIASNYLQSWFLVDFLSTFPWMYFVQEHHWSMLLRLLKLFRLGRLAQSLSGSSFLLQYERMRAVNYDMLTLIRFVIILPLVIHVMGCGLFIVAAISKNEYDFIMANGIEADPHFDQWIYGIYWAAMTVTTIGYGDVSLVTYSERGYATVAMLIGATCYAYLVGAIINVVLNMTSSDHERRQHLKRINELMAKIQYPSREQIKFRHFLAVSSADKSVQLEDYKEDLDLLSTPMAASLARHMFRKWLPKIWWLRSKDDTFTIRLALLVRDQSFSPGDSIFEADSTASAFFILSSGVISRYADKKDESYLGKPWDLNSSNLLFGQECILKTGFAYSYCALAVTYVKVWRIDRKPFFDLLEEFPKIRARVRWAAAFMLIRKKSIPSSYQ